MSAAPPGAADEAPLVTLALVAYNQERYIQEALDGALAQTYSPLEIVLSDDCSKDRTFEIMCAAAARYQGPHRIVLNRNARNLNIGGHINALAGLASGSLVVLAAGDDVSLPRRVETLVAKWVELGRPTMVMCSDFEAIDVSSREVRFPRVKLQRDRHSKRAMAAGEIFVLGATTAYSHDVLTQFPPMSTDVRHEDRVLPFRALLLGGRVEVIDAKLVRYRVEGGVSTRQRLTARQYLFDYMPELSSKILPDAFQRLRDLDEVSSSDRSLRRLCHSAIAEQAAVMALAKARGPALEAACLQAALQGARWFPMLRLYLRFRLYPLFAVYYRVKNRSQGTDPSTP